MAQGIRLSLFALILRTHDLLFTAVSMKTNKKYFEQLRARIKKRSNDIDQLRLQNESVKKQIINKLMEDSGTDFPEKAEQMLELLLHTDHAIDVLRHDFSEFTLSGNWINIEKEAESCIGALQKIETAIFQTAKLLEDVQASVARQ